MFSYAFPETQVQQFWSLGTQHCPTAAAVSELCLPPGTALAAAAAGMGARGGPGEPKALSGRAELVSLLPAGMVVGKGSPCPWKDAVGFIQRFLWRRRTVSRCR